MRLCKQTRQNRDKANNRLYFTRIKFTADITKRFQDSSHKLTVQTQEMKAQIILQKWTFLFSQNTATCNGCSPETWAQANLCYVRGNRSATFSRVDLVRSGNWMSNSTIMSPRRLGSFEYGRPSPAIRRMVVGFIMSGTFSVAVRLLSVGTLIVTPPSMAYRN